MQSVVVLRPQDEQPLSVSTNARQLLQDWDEDAAVVLYGADQMNTHDEIPFAVPEALFMDHVQDQPLRHLILSGRFWTMVFLEPLLTPRLERLSVADMAADTVLLLLMALPHCPNLKALEIKNCSFRVDRDMPDDPSLKLPPSLVTFLLEDVVFAGGALEWLLEGLATAPGHRPLRVSFTGTNGGITFDHPIADAIIGLFREKSSGRPLVILFKGFYYALTGAAIREFWTCTVQTSVKVRFVVEECSLGWWGTMYYAAYLEQFFPRMTTYRFARLLVPNTYDVGPPPEREARYDRCVHFFHWMARPQRRCISLDLANNNLASDEARHNIIAMLSRNCSIKVLNLADNPLVATLGAVSSLLVAWEPAIGLTTLQCGIVSLDIPVDPQAVVVFDAMLAATAGRRVHLERLDMISDVAWPGLQLGEFPWSARLAHDQRRIAALPWTVDSHRRVFTSPGLHQRIFVILQCCNRFTARYPTRQLELPLELWLLIFSYWQRHDDNRDTQLAIADETRGRHFYG